MKSNHDEMERRMVNVENQVSEINTNIKDLLNFLINQSKTEFSDEKQTKNKI
jgi:hypothetical protein